MTPGLGHKYDIEIDTISKAKEEYMTDENKMGSMECPKPAGDTSYEIFEMLP